MLYIYRMIRFLFSIVVVFSLFSQLLLAGNISLSSRTATDYQANSLTYAHSFNEEYTGSVYYSYDGLEKRFNSLQLSLDKNLDENSYGQISYGTDNSVDYSKTRTIGFMYGLKFKDKLVEDYEQEQAAAQFLIPRLTLGLNFSNMELISENYTDTARNIVVGLGVAIGQYLDCALLWNGFSYSSERTLKNNVVSRITNNPLLQQLSSAPRSSLDGTITLLPLDILQIYYSTNRTVALLGETAGSKTIGLSLSLFESLSLDISKEETTDNTAYSAVALGYSF